MYETVSFNIYKEHLENIVFAERENRIEANKVKKEPEDKPIPKPPPDWTDSVNYRSSNRESAVTNSI